MNRPMIIRYQDEEDSSIDEQFLRVYGTINRYTKPKKKRNRSRKGKVRENDVDIFYL